MPAQGQECSCQSFDEIAVLFKTEGTYSDDSIPTTAEAVLFTGQPTITIEGDNVERDIAKPYWGNDKHQLVNKFITLTGEVEVTGPGAAGNVPGAAAILRACGLAETVTALTDAQYDPASVSIESGSMYFYIGTDLWKVAGVRGNAKLTMQAKQFAKWTFTLTGLFSLPGHNATMPTIPAPSDADPLVLNFDNTPTASFFATGIALESYELDMGNIIEKNDKPGCYSVSISGRNPTSNIVMCAPGIDVLDIRTTASSGTLGAVSVVLGVTAGEIFKVDVAKNQMDLTGITDTQIGTNEKGISVPLKPLSITGGDDDFKFTFQ